MNIAGAMRNPLRANAKEAKGEGLRTCAMTSPTPRRRPLDRFYVSRGERWTARVDKAHATHRRGDAAALQARRGSLPGGRASEVRTVLCLCGCKQLARAVGAVMSEMWTGPKRTSSR